MTTKEAELINSLLAFVTQQNDIIRDQNTIFKNVITEMNDKHTELETKVQALKDGIFRIKQLAQEVLVVKP